MIPSAIGLDGKLGGEHKGQWWKGTYGWNFTIFDGELGQIAHRNYFTDGTWPGFGNGLLLSGDQTFVDTLRKQMDLLYAQKKVEKRPDAASPDVWRSEGLQGRRQAGVVSVRPAAPHRPAGRDLLLVDEPEGP
jgi:hypothetical protein